MLSFVIIAAIALAVYLGYKTKINTGFFCIVFFFLLFEIYLLPLFIKNHNIVK